MFSLLLENEFFIITWVQLLSCIGNLTSDCMSTIDYIVKNVSDAKWDELKGQSAMHKSIFFLHVSAKLVYQRVEKIAIHWLITFFHCRIRIAFPSCQKWIYVQRRYFRVESSRDQKFVWLKLVYSVSSKQTTSSFSVLSVYLILTIPWHSYFMSLITVFLVFDFIILLIFYRFSCEISTVLLNNS